ncbi:AbrB/MazE/SpoVT family DNA-binding domain-containing protein [Halalkalicoccus sp. NIPERK01]|uniref:AbrB/MazE/SpoVT family DNA-binding domain-containing protein n=1 Tax=Halalkalicoccus sp. NIPERK01 TaxID=3053469 RepID=UPI00256F63D1|nr:AbrB/MazE/SpoVT family DNA-binding domain-containing protein [Halalkalicoccus sp. NIPERK01]MDL5362511.1 AbrB/MazE/SpoVT family DNA-binding domain-containing protein [Halalkalicoccus sp. NIPERK01]
MSITTEATITSKGQITIPKEIRDRLELTQGETISFELTEEGVVVMRKAGDPLAQLRELREEITFSEADIKAMKRDSKHQWSKYE